MHAAAKMCTLGAGCTINFEHFCGSLPSSQVFKSAEVLGVLGDRVRQQRIDTQRLFLLLLNHLVDLAPTRNQTLKITWSATKWERGGGGGCK